MKKKKILTYSDEENYIVCLCEINDDDLKKVREEIKKNTTSYELLHTFDNMLAQGEEVINLEPLITDLQEDIESTSLATASFLNILNIQENKIYNSNDFSYQIKCYQNGIFSYEGKLEDDLNQYKSSFINGKIIRTIGYDIRKKLENDQKRKEKVLVATI